MARLRPEKFIPPLIKFFLQYVFFVISKILMKTREKTFSSTVNHLNGLGERKMKIDIVCQSNAHFLLTNANIYGS